MRLIIYVEIHLERNLQFELPSEGLLLLKNSIKNEEVIELDNFSDNEYLNLIIKSFSSIGNIILVLNQLDEKASLGSTVKLLRSLKSYKGDLRTYAINCKIPAFYKPMNFKNVEELSKAIDDYF